MLLRFFFHQAEQQQVYGTIINTYNVSVSDIPDVNGTDANATTAVPETVFTVLTEEGDTRISKTSTFITKDITNCLLKKYSKKTPFNMTKKGIQMLSLIIFVQVMSQLRLTSCILNADFWNKYVYYKLIF